MSINSKFSPEIPVDTLFHFADVDGDGMIGGSDALFFFQYTKLPMNILSKIWSLSVPPKKPMYLSEFAKALVLIYYAQQNQPISNELFTKLPPYNSPIIDIPFFLKEDQIKHADNLFTSLINTDHITVTKDVFAEKVLAQYSGVLTIDDIMKITAKTNPNELDRNEFLLALALLKNQKAGFPVPKTIPSYFNTYVNTFKYHTPQPSTPIIGSTVGSPAVEKPTEHISLTQKELPKIPTKAIPPLPEKVISTEKVIEHKESTNPPSEVSTTQNCEEKKEEIKTPKSSKEIKEEKKKAEELKKEEEKKKKEALKEEERRKKEEKKRAEELRKEEERKKKEEKKEEERRKKEEKKNKKSQKEIKEESHPEEHLNEDKDEHKSDENEEIKKEETSTKQEIFNTFSFDQPIENKIPTSIVKSKKTEELFSFGDAFNFDATENKESNHEQINPITSQKTQPLEVIPNKTQEEKVSSGINFDTFSFDTPVTVNNIPSSVVKSSNSNVFSFETETTKDKEEEEQQKNPEIDFEEINKKLEEIKKEEGQCSNEIQEKMNQIEQLQKDIKELEMKKRELTKKKQELETKLGQNKTIGKEEKGAIKGIPISEQTKESVTPEEEKKMVFGKNFNKNAYGFKGNPFVFPIPNEEPTVPYSSMFEGII
ncbi:neurofilament medium polypeptide, putative [Entamoeba dispar SAW760]|uniref:Neurofilament medium polypeptide, putative n=1 Tax=Entamoeba dispar (strain ATCC PRA-260 / SAW760) TaxID=370354 RepID=B0EQI0_ENTDS|nr:neurofilament medium polypeptide, putative [Entamoeba dispar SAW760]EDR23235.1 neurofilament medium polypeptide, putative [Entamoeba dispar SAW760]|eukprot:EDR23235.1 neurofilament medium polypeptide, putative [Entamoeba dispar SAW760]